MGASGSCVESEVSTQGSSCCPEICREDHPVLRTQVWFPGAGTAQGHENMVCWKDIGTFKYTNVRNMRLRREISICMDVLCWHLQNPGNRRPLQNVMYLPRPCEACIHTQEDFLDRHCRWCTWEAVGTQPHLSSSTAHRLPCSLGWKGEGSWRARGLLWAQFAFSVTESCKEISHVHSRNTSYPGNFNYLTKVIKYAWGGNVRQVYKLVDKLIST